MPSRRRRRASGAQLSTDAYGRLQAPGLATARKVRKMRSGVAQFRHRAKNGVYDPYTYFHIVDALLNVQPNKPFSGREFAEHLGKYADFMIWDPVTIGRVLNDLHDNWNDANPNPESQPLILYRDWHGSYYEVNGSPAAKAAIWRLAEDLILLCQVIHDLETEGRAPKRLYSPLRECPSVMDEAEAIEAA